MELFVDGLLLAARGTLAIVFFVAGCAKLVDRVGSRQAAMDFGAPPTVATFVSIVLPPAELVVAVALVPVASAWWGAIGAVTLLLVFVLAIAYNLAQGRQPHCQCFGQIQTSPIGWATLARNAALMALAGLVVSFGPERVGPSLTRWFSSPLGVERALLVFSLLAVTAQGWFLFQLFAQHGRILNRLDDLQHGLLPGSALPGTTPRRPGTGELQVGATAPPFALRSIEHSTPVSLRHLLRDGNPLLLVFMHPNCGPCTALLSEIAEWRRKHGSKLNFVIVSRGSVKENRDKFAGIEGTLILVQENDEVSKRYSAAGTPSAVLIRRDATIGSGVVAGAAAIRGVIKRVVHEGELQRTTWEDQA